MEIRQKIAKSLLKKGKSDEDLVGVELDLQHLAQGLDVGGRRLAAVPGGSASLFFKSYFSTVFFHLSRVSSGDGDVVRAAISAGGHVKLAGKEVDKLDS